MLHNINPLSYSEIEDINYVKNKLIAEEEQRGIIFNQKYELELYNKDNENKITELQNEIKITESKLERLKTKLIEKRKLLETDSERILQLIDLFESEIIKGIDYVKSKPDKHYYSKYHYFGEVHRYNEKMFDLYKLLDDKNIKYNNNDKLINCLCIGFKDDNFNVNFFESSWSLGPNDG